MESNWREVVPMSGELDYIHRRVEHKALEQEVQPDQDWQEEKPREEKKEELEELESQGYIPEVLLEDSAVVKSMVAKAQNSLMKMPRDI